MHYYFILGLFTLVSLPAVEISVANLKAVVPDAKKPFTVVSDGGSVTWTLGKEPATLTIAIVVHMGGGVAKDHAKEVLGFTLLSGATVTAEKGMGGAFQLLETTNPQSRMTSRAAVSTFSDGWISLLLTNNPGFHLEPSQRQEIDELLTGITIQGKSFIPPTALRFLAP